MPVMRLYSVGYLLLVLSLLMGCDTSPVDPGTPVFGTAESPSGTDATAMSTSRINVLWQDNSSSETGFEVHRSTAGANGAFVLRTSTGAGATVYADAALTAATQYCYKVRAFRAMGGKTSYSQFSATACATTATPPPQPGSIHVTTATTGDYPDPDGYVIRVDGGPDQLMGPNAAVTIANVSGGDHMVWLGGVSWNCAVDGVNPRSISVNGGTTDVGFAIDCGPGGTLQVTTVTRGVDLDPDGYHVSAIMTCSGTPNCFGGDAGEADVRVNDTVTISLLRGGVYLLDLEGVSLNCDLRGAPRSFLVGVSGAIELDVDCAPATQLAFADTAGGNTDIYVITSNRTERTRLTADPARDVEPAWSPDGGKLACTSDRDGNAEIYVMNADGSNPVRLTNAAGIDYRPAWSRDGKIAFTSERDGYGGIFVMNADGTNPVNLTHGMAGAWDPAWSPDGDRIAFVADAGIYVMSADGSGVTRLASSEPGDAGPAWSPDGATIAFSRVVWNPEYGPTSVIMVMNADGSGAWQLTATENHTDPAWYPDGRKIAYVVWDSYRDPYTTLSTTVEVVRLDGTEPFGRLPFTFTNGFSPAWRR